MLLCEICASRVALRRLQRRGASNRLAGDRNPVQWLAENAQETGRTPLTTGTGIEQSLPVA
jgi:hypothetical protein